MSNQIQIINLADNINAAIHKINQNFENAQGLSEEDVLALIAAELAKLVDDTGFTEEEIRTFLASATLDLGSNKILYSNVFSTVGDLPDASTYHGMFAHVHGTGAAYFAHGGQWIELANKSDVGTGSSDVENLDDLTDVDTTGKTIGQVLKWNGTIWTADDESGGGGGPGGTSVYTVTVYARSPKGTTFNKT